MAKGPKTDKDLINNNKEPKTYADKRRDERKQALRELLQGQKYLDAIHGDLDRAITQEELPVVKFKTDTRLKLLGKVLPDLKAVEVSADDSSGGVIYSWGKPIEA